MARTMKEIRATEDKNGKYVNSGFTLAQKEKYKAGRDYGKWKFEDEPNAK